MCYAHQEHEAGPCDRQAGGMRSSFPSGAARRRDWSADRLGDTQSIGQQVVEIVRRMGKAVPFQFHGLSQALQPLACLRIEIAQTTMVRLQSLPEVVPVVRRLIPQLAGQFLCYFHKPLLPGVGYHTASFVPSGSDTKDRKVDIIGGMQL